MATAARMRRTVRRAAITAMWLALSLVYLFPYVWMVMTGVRDPLDTLSLPPKLWFHPTLAGFGTIFRTTGFQHYLLNSAIVAVKAPSLCLFRPAPPRLCPC